MKFKVDDDVRIITTRNLNAYVTDPSFEGLTGKIYNGYRHDNIETLMNIAREVGIYPVWVSPSGTWNSSDARGWAWFHQDDLRHIHHQAIEANYERLRKEVQNEV